MIIGTSTKPGFKKKLQEKIFCFATQILIDNVAVVADLEMIKCPGHGTHQASCHLHPRKILSMPESRAREYDMSGTFPSKVWTDFHFSGHIYT